MVTRLYFLLVCVASIVVGQNCNCPLIGIPPETETLSCPIGNTLTITSISTAGACRNPRTTTTTTTQTAGECNCPTPSNTYTVKATPDCPGVTSTSTLIKPTIDCPWAATVTQTITKYSSSNSTAYPITGGSAASTRFLPTGTAPSRPIGTAPSRPTCTLDSLPDNFYLRDSLSGYLLYDPISAKVIGCPKKADATLFHVNNTDDFDLSGIPQLSLYSPVSTPSDNEEYGAYVEYDGGPVQFFQAGRVPEEGDWYIVTASFSTYLCQLSLITWNLHDLSTPEDCGGYLSLGYGFGEDECPRVRLTVEAA